MAACATGVPITAGPIEATAFGNLAVQFMVRGDIKDIWQARRVIRNSFDTIEYLPKDTAVWEEAYQRFAKIVEIG